MLTLFGLILVSGHPGDGLFVGVVVSNSLVGIVQETRARRELARLEVLNEPAATVVRDGAEAPVRVDAVVLDDVVAVEVGHQVVVDGRVVAARSLEVDESLLTGESDPVVKRVGDEVRSGSFVVAGGGRYRAVGIGGDSYAARLASEARRFSMATSELRQGVDRVLHWMTAVIPVASAVLLWSLLSQRRRLAGGLAGHGRGGGGHGPRRPGAAHQHRLRRRGARPGPPQRAGQAADHGGGPGPGRRPVPGQDGHDHHRDHGPGRGGAARDRVRGGGAHHARGPGGRRPRPELDHGGAGPRGRGRPGVGGRRGRALLQRPEVVGCDLRPGHLRARCPRRGARRP